MRFAGQALVRISDIGHEFCDAWDMDPAAEARQKKFQAERRAAEEREVQPLKNQEQGRHCGLLLQGAGLKGNYGPWVRACIPHFCVWVAHLRFFSQLQADVRFPAGTHLCHGTQVPQNLLVVKYTRLENVPF